MMTVPLTLQQANMAVAAWHRHHKPVVGHKFSIGVVKDGRLVGAAICGRPVARGIDHRQVLEVTRLATDGTPNVCSFAYSSCARAAKAMGYRRIQTYILASEPGTSPEAAGWTLDGIALGRPWIHTDGKPRRTDQPVCDKKRYVRQLESPLEPFEMPHRSCQTPSLFLTSPLENDSLGLSAS